MILTVLQKYVLEFPKSVFWVLGRRAKKDFFFFLQVEFDGNGVVLPAHKISWSVTLRTCLNVYVGLWRARRWCIFIWCTTFLHLCRRIQRQAGFCFSTYYSNCRWTVLIWPFDLVTWKARWQRRPGWPPLTNESSLPWGLGLLSYPRENNQLPIDLRFDLRAEEPNFVPLFAGFLGQVVTRLLGLNV